MINLNKSFITKNDILKYVTDVEIYNTYLGDEKVNLSGNMKSPLRDEKDPSFGFFRGTTGEICWKDFVLGTGDFVAFVRMKYGLTYFEALSRIASDFNIPDKDFFYKKFNDKIEVFTGDDKILSNVGRAKLNVRRRVWNQDDAKFWSQFGIVYNTMIKYNVSPIDYISVNDVIVKADKYAYVFSEFKDGKETYKIYQPFNNKFKWLCNHDDSVWQGWEQLPDMGDNLIITKSLKDVMSLHDVLGIHSTSLQTENVSPKFNVIESLKKRFVDVYLLYDNDFDKETNWGELFAKKFADKYNVSNIIRIPTKYKSKDFSDLVKNHGKEVASEIVKSQICPF